MNKLSRKEFKDLLLEWKRNTLLERNISSLKVTYPSYIIRTINYGDIEYDREAENNLSAYQEELENNLRKNGVDFMTIHNDQPVIILQVHTDDFSVEQKKEITKKIVNIVFNSCESGEYYSSKVSIQKPTHPYVESSRKEELYNISMQDIENTFNDILKTGNNSAPIFISHLDYDNNIYYAIHDIIGHGSAEKQMYNSSIKGKTRDFHEKIRDFDRMWNVKIGEKDYKKHVLFITDCLQDLTPGIDETDISASLYSFFASINPNEYENEITNFLNPDSENNLVIKESIELLCNLYEEYLKDVEYTESNIDNSILREYKDSINICFMNINF